MTHTTSKPQRPLSPHLQVYKPQISSVLSILHRLTGVFLSSGSLLLALWLFAAAYNIELFDTLNGFFTSIIGIIALIAWSAAFYYHLCNGVRHLFWDMGKGFDVATMTKTGMAVLAAAALLTAATWIYILGAAS